MCSLNHHALRMSRQSRSSYDYTPAPIANAFNRLARNLGKVRTSQNAHERHLHTIADMAIYAGFLAVTFHELESIMTPFGRSNLASSAFSA
jgi:hypothetical protein